MTKTYLLYYIHIQAVKSIFIIVFGNTKQESIWKTVELCLACNESNVTSKKKRNK